MTDLEALTSCIAKASNEDELYAELAQCMMRLARSHSCEILIREGESLVLRASTRAPEYNHRVRLGKGVGVSGHVMESGKPVFISEAARTDSLFAHYPGIDDSPFESLVAIPIPPDVGVCMLRREDPWRVSGTERERLTQSGVWLALAISSFQHAYTAGLNASRLGALSEVTSTITQSPYIEEILQLLVNLTAQQFNYVVCTVRLLDETHQELVLRATQAPAKAYARKRAIKLGESIAGKAIAENRPVIVSDVQEEDDYIGHDLAVEQGMRSMVCVPLTMQGRAIGVLSCYTSEIREFPAEEIRALETLAKQAAVSIEHAKLQVRNTLMQEMHHRVKNSLQQVAALLRLEMRQAHYKSLEEALSDVLARILAISSVHDLLSREDLDHVGIRSVAEMLVQHQMNSLIAPGRSISFEVRGDDVRLNMTQATQVALVLNELIQNAVEHGFQHATQGQIHVTVESKDGEVGLWVSNDGDKLAPGFDASTGSHLGLQIVDNLAKGLGGRFTLEDRQGWTVAEVKFSQAGMNLG